MPRRNAQPRQRALRRELADSIECGDEPGARLVDDRDRVLEPGKEFGVRALEVGGDQVVLRREMPVKGHLRHPDRAMIVSIPIAADVLAGAAAGRGSLCAERSGWAARGMRIVTSARYRPVSYHW